MYLLAFSMIMVMSVSLGSQTLANLCLRGYDKIHNPESLEERDMGNTEIPAKRSSIELKGKVVGDLGLNI
jgi:hypothetical protein